MGEDVYLQLARHLDSIPNGYPPTESGIERRLLAKLFTPEEARLALLLTLTADPPSDIAARAGLDPDETRKALKGMAQKGLIGFERRDGQLVFSLIPFIVGFYESQLPRLDRELADLFEQYYHETRGAIVRDQPSVHRVIPVGEAIPIGLEIFPYERATALVEGARAWGVRDCICRVQQRLIGKGCDHPVETCLVFAQVEGAFDHSPIDRPLTKEEALRILLETEAAGLVHSSGNYRDGLEYICNCCTCSCAILRSMVEFGVPSAIAHSDFHTVVEADRCSGCGDCLEHCPFQALSAPDLLAVVDGARCMGCGLCAPACSTGALHLERRPADETAIPPQDVTEWRALRSTWRAAHRQEGIP